MEKCDFEKNSVTFLKKSQNFAMKKYFPPKGIFENFGDFLKKVTDFFPKSNFSMMKKYFSSGFF